jgi:hypothetical protein
MTQEEILQLIASIPGHGKHKVLTTDVKGNPKWEDKNTFVKYHLPDLLATKKFVEDFTSSIAYYFGDTFVGTGLTPDDPINTKK